jgi:hypothetical protein
VSCFFSCICIVAQNRSPEHDVLLLSLHLGVCTCQLPALVVTSRCYKHIRYLSEHLVLLHLFTLCCCICSCSPVWNQPLIFTQSAVSLQHIPHFKLQRTHDKSITYSHVHYSFKCMVCVRSHASASTSTSSWPEIKALLNSYTLHILITYTPHI